MTKSPGDRYQKVYRDGEKGDTYRWYPLFGSIVKFLEDEEATDASVHVSEGGWLQGKWMNAAEFRAAKTRWADHSQETGKAEADYDPKDKGWIPHQCGGCRFFAAFDGDYGLCANPASPNDGRVVFEHGGCKEHSQPSWEAQP